MATLCKSFISFPIFYTLEQDRVRISIVLLVKHNHWSLTNISEPYNVKCVTELLLIKHHLIY